MGEGYAKMVGGKWVRSDEEIMYVVNGSRGFACAWVGIWQENHVPGLTKILNGVVCCLSWNGIEVSSN